MPHDGYPDRGRDILVKFLRVANYVYEGYMHIRIKYYNLSS